jgi:transcriptional regulator with XRE-family HTH domain
MRRSFHSQAYKSAVAKLIDARHEAGLTQRDLAEKLGKARSFVGKMEAGERRVDFVEFIVIARALGVDEGELLRSIAAELPKRFEL